MAAPVEVLVFTATGEDAAAGAARPSAAFRFAALALLAHLGLALAAGDAVAQGGGAPPQLHGLPGQDEPLGPIERKIHTQLLAAMASAEEAPGAEPVELDIVATVSDALLERIRQLGGSVVNAFPADHAIRARLPLGQIRALAAEPAVLSVDPATWPTTHADVAATEGDIAHDAKLARQQYFADPGTAGAGVKVCVISDSNDDGNGALQHAKDVGAIDAQNTTVLTVRQNGQDVVQDGMAFSPHTGEGLAMMEIVHQLAPGASIEFATGYPSQSQMKENILGLADGGCHIIVDDISFTNELPFQEDIVGEGVRKATALGISYFSSATNFGNVVTGNASAWEGAFADSGHVATSASYPGHFHSFGRVGYMTVTAESGKAGDRISLTGTDPVTGAPVNIASDYDLYLTDSDDKLIAYSAGRPTASQQAIDLGNVPSHPKLLVGDQIYVLKRPFAAAGQIRLRLDTNGAATSAFSTKSADYVTVTAESGRDIDQISLFWNDPVTSPPANVPNEYDLLLADAQGTVIVNAQGVPAYAAGPSGAPRQVIDLSNFPDHPKLVVGDRIYVLKRPGAADRMLHLDTSGAAISPFTSGRTRGHNASPAPFAYGIAALHAASPPVAFTANGGIAPASADGPRLMFFRPDGSAIPGDGATVLKPDFTAAEGVTTTFPVGNDLHRFVGSSAAAPHAAAIAALVLSKYPSMNPARLRYVLNHATLPNGASDLPAGAPAWNRFAGRGILMASLALAEAKRVADEQHLSVNCCSSLLLKPEGSVLDERVSQYQLLYGTAPPPLSDVTKLSMSDSHAVALRRDGTLVAWSAVEQPLLGPGEALVIPAGLSGVVDVAAGAQFTIAAKSNGTVTGWGSPLVEFLPDGQLREIPFALPQGLTGIRSVFATGSQWTSGNWAAITLDGSLARWDREGNPLPIPPLRGVVTLAMGEQHGAALMPDGTVSTWRWDGGGAMPVPGALGITAIAAGDHHALALKRDGTVMAWTCSGCDNEAGQATVPAGLANVVAIAADGSTSYALTADGTVTAWGRQPQAP